MAFYSPLDFLLVLSTCFLPRRGEPLILCMMQLRDNAFSSYGHKGKKHTNDPRMWPDKYKKSIDLPFSAYAYPSLCMRRT